MRRWRRCDLSPLAHLTPCPFPRREGERAPLLVGEGLGGGGLGCPFFTHRNNPRHHIDKIIVDLLILKSQDHQTTRTQIRIPFRILFDLLIVDFSIHFDNQRRRVAIEIRDISTL